MIENNVDTAFFHSWFRNYVKSFYTEDPKTQRNIRLKEEHTLRVCSLCFIDDILNNRVSNSHDLKTFNDMKLLQLGWIFDINFTPTFLYIQQRRIIEKIITALPDTEDIRKIQTHLKAYLEKRISEK